MLIVIDLGTSNLSGVCHALAKCGVDYEVTDDPDVIAEERAIALPWTGPLPGAMEAIEQTGIREALHDAVAHGASLLAMGSGMLLLADEVAPGQRGLGLVPGRVSGSLLSGGTGRMRPLVGWAPIERVQPDPLLQDVTHGAYVYFLTSQILDVDDPNVRVADARLGPARIAAAVRSGSVYGLLFEADKSGEVGLRILENFLRRSAAVSGRFPRPSTQTMRMLEGIEPSPTGTLRNAGTPSARPAEPPRPPAEPRS